MNYSRKTDLGVERELTDGIGMVHVQTSCV